MAPTKEIKTLDALKAYASARERMLAHVDEVSMYIKDGQVKDSSTLGSILCEMYPEEVERGKELHAQVGQFLSAGTETTASLLTTFILFHSQSSELWNKVRTEIIVGNRGATEARLNEILRLYPPAALITRQPVEDVMIEGLAIPAGTEIYISPYVTQREQTEHHDPEVFDHTRWLRSEGNNGAFFPFGFGPRMCIGYPTAMHTAVELIRLIFTNFDPVVFNKFEAPNRHLIILSHERDVPLSLRRRTI